MAHEAWSRDEVEAAVADYFQMLQWELSGIAYNKADQNERLRALVHRSRGSIEFKHANISAILTLYGYPYIDGYKPRGNFQALLEQAVLEFIDAHRDFFDPLVSGPVLNPGARAADQDFRSCAGHGGASRTDACSGDGLVADRPVVEDRLRR
jgi:hypothetical protein